MARSRGHGSFAAMRYEPSPKHKEPWQPGRKGSMCPRELDEAGRNALLERSVEHGDKRYATDGRRAFEAQQHGDGVWHGYPVGWATPSVGRKSPRPCVVDG